MIFGSFDEHRVSEAEEAVLFLNGDLVGGHRLVVAVEGSNQHDKGALRQVEVRNQAVDGFQLDAGIDEDAGIPAARHDLAVLSPDRFQRAAARGNADLRAHGGNLSYPEL